MKKWSMVLGILVGLNLIALMANMVTTAHAQDPTISPYYFAVASSAPHTQCPIKTGVTAWCFASDGEWESDNGGAWYKIGTASAPGVLTFNGRKPDASGNVAPAANDYSYAMLSGTVPIKPAWTCNSASGVGIITANSNGGITLTSLSTSGCN